MVDQARVVIIGGGAVGASCLYHLAKANITDCLLLEKDELTSGSTWHAAGNIPTYATSWLGMRAGNYAWQLYKDLDKAVDYPISYRHTGAFWPAHNQDRMDVFKHLVGVSKSAGFDLSMLSPRQMQDMHPYYQPDSSVLGGIYDPYEGDIDPSQLTQALIKGARDAGARVQRFTPVNAIARSNTSEWELTTDKGKVRGEIIINASGFYGTQIANMVGCSLPVSVLEHQYLVTEPLQALEQDEREFPLVRDPDIRFYLRRERAGFLFGSYAHAGRLAFTKGIPENFSHGLFEDSIDDMIELLEKAIDYVPILAESGIKQFVNGPIGYSPDGLPLCGPAYGLPNFYHACGIQIGITHSAAVGKAMAEWIDNGETEWDYSAWDPRRFGDWATREYADKRIVELYGLQYAIAYPHRILQSARPVQTTALYEALKSKGAVMGQIGGWERALWFHQGNDYSEQTLSFRNTEPWRKSALHESVTVRDHVGVMDHGGMTKFQVSGVNARDYLDRLSCGKLPEVGRVKLSYFLTPKGKIFSEAIIAQIKPDQFLLCGPTLADKRDYDWLAKHLPEDDSVSLQYGYKHDALLMVMGPKSRALLSQLTDTDISKQCMPWMSVCELSIAGCDTTVLRVSYVGELGFEIHLNSENLVAVYDEICRLGKQFNLTDFGSYALNAMRLEKGYHAWGADFGTEYTLFEAGLDHFADVSKADFIGRDAVLDQRRQLPRYRFIKMIVNNQDADPMAGDPIFCQGQCVGYVTSGGMGFRTGNCLALGYIETQIVSDVWEFEIEILGERCPVQRCVDPVYDPQNSLLKEETPAN